MNLFARSLIVGSLVLPAALIGRTVAAGEPACTAQGEPTGEAHAHVHGFMKLIAGSVAAPEALVRIDLATGVVETIRAASGAAVNPGYLSAPEAIEFPTDEGLTAHAFFYAPRNRNFTGPDSERPPLLVVGHGGPERGARTLAVARPRRGHLDLVHEVTKKLSKVVAASAFTRNPHFVCVWN